MFVDTKDRRRCLHLMVMVFSYVLPATGRTRDFHPLERALIGLGTLSDTTNGHSIYYVTAR